MLYTFTYRSGPDWKTKETLIELRDSQEAVAFADGLRLGGAVEVTTQLTNERNERP